MATSKGVIQGYTGVATVDEKTQIIVDAQAHGTGSEQELLLPVIKATAALRHIDTVITADAGYHSPANLKALAEWQINAYIPDNGYRKRDERYADQYLYAVKPDPLWNKAKQAKKSNCFKPAGFRLADDCSHCVCPVCKRLQQWIGLHHQWLCGDEIQRSQTRLRTVQATQGMFAHPRKDSNTAGFFLPR
ncbi:MAG: hypothetical protein DID92_2727744963 [Candidatus Nitrotoga sp. SPKER]|nr:MAG: hypothetical protein DID92_2727744963 [Candidatus Nitrotoga sp. SPKER]